MLSPFLSSDTIVALSTPPGISGIGIVRISGKESLKILKRIFRHKKDITPHHLIYGHIIDPKNDEIIDEVLAVYMQKPKTYTREDIVEINCHGGLYVIKKIISLVLSEGARLAEPGEFTKRAYLNGRIDLTQAEAVIDIVKSKTEKAVYLAQRQLKGELSKKVKKIQDELKEIISLVEAHIDFPEEDIPFPVDEIIEKVKKIKTSITMLISTYKEGQMIKEGIKTVIAGRTNVGKSSLLNALLEKERAIVTPIPGTTRDIIEDSIEINGFPFILYDIAGIRDSKDVIEKEGMKRAIKSIEDADLIIFVLDGSEPLKKEDYDIFELIKDKNLIIVKNKIDLPQKIELKKIKRDFKNKNIIDISALKGDGIEELKNKMGSVSLFGGADYIEEKIAINFRQKLLLEKSEIALSQAIDAINDNIGLEFIALDLREAMDALGEIVGQVTSEDILNNIFSQFCIGK
ncbi:MAG: tRNA uridine-5-carboxymethylaminomethyl(34) synthesis GTPase MnmE [Thermoplasmata archaeon]|nr:tRNA uridine-5-carboxymethylaminomethyl(34) synthesis GTPase MnmE [Deltaproteobacteria bacterium]RLF27118.1 MAG: tRNA uridine-5-carboxymethylaminomethyl(34) synthesis GTPase MnmE [Thermoplasmata archaeon]